MTAAKKVLIVYPEITGYALAGWKALAARPDIELHVLAGHSGLADKDNAFEPEERHSWLTLLGKDARQSAACIREIADSFAPSVAFVSGWGNAAFEQVAYRKRTIGCRVVLGLDTVLRRPVRQVLGRVRLWNYLRRVDAFLVPGERGREFLSRWWGIPHAKIHTGLLGADVPRWQEAHIARKGVATWPRSFLFVGRYIPLKGIQELLIGYRSYRASVTDPMEFRFCGQGPLAEEIQQTPGVKDLGFVQPKDMIEVWTGAGCFVLPSRYDAWPVALLEACAAGLPLVASVRCGSSVELLRDGFNGMLVKDTSSDAIATALLTMHERYQEWPAMGERSASMALPYSPDQWAFNVTCLVNGLVNERGPI